MFWQATRRGLRYQLHGRRSYTRVCQRNRGGTQPVLYLTRLDLRYFSNQVNSTATFGDAEFFSIYFLNMNNQKLSGEPVLKIGNPKNLGTQLFGKLPESTPIPENASKIIAIAANLAFGEAEERGEYDTIPLLDLAIPMHAPTVREKFGIQVNLVCILGGRPPRYFPRGWPVRRRCGDIFCAR